MSFKYNENKLYANKPAIKLIVSNFLIKVREFLNIAQIAVWINFVWICNDG